MKYFVLHLNVLVTFDRCSTEKWRVDVCVLADGECRLRAGASVHRGDVSVQQNWAPAVQYRQRPARPIRNGEACGQHPACGAEPATGRHGVRLPQHPARPAGAAHYPPANARGLHTGGAARTHAVVLAAAHRKPMRAWDRSAGRGQLTTSLFRCSSSICSNITKLWSHLAVKTKWS